MSTLVTKYIQLGKDSTVSNNYVISTPVSPDGSLRISNGIVGNVTDVMVIKPTTIQFEQNVGIGKTPTSALDVDGTINATSFSGAFSGDGANLTNLPIREAFNATGSAPVYACRAWVNFNGTGTVAIRASGNVSSITDNGTGLYTVNFTTAMPDANYSTVATSAPTSNGANWATGSLDNTGDYSTTKVKVWHLITGGGTGSSLNTPIFNVAVFR